MEENMPIDPNITILLVEDSAVMRKMELKVLKSLGIKHILEAGDGKIAQEFVSKNQDIRLIISDWNMPNMDGYQLLTWVRETSPHKSLPFIMASGRGEKSEISKAKDAGVSCFIAKPFNGAEIDKPRSGGVMTIHDSMIGMAKKGETVKTLLDMETLLNSKQALEAVA